MYPTSVIFKESETFQVMDVKANKDKTLKDSEIEIEVLRQESGFLAKSAMSTFETFLVPKLVSSGQQLCSIIVKLLGM